MAGLWPLASEQVLGAPSSTYHTSRTQHQIRGKPQMWVGNAFGYMGSPRVTSFCCRSFNGVVFARFFLGGGGDITYFIPQKTELEHLKMDIWKRRISNLEIMIVRFQVVNFGWCSITWKRTSWPDPGIQVVPKTLSFWSFNNFWSWFL